MHAGLESFRGLVGRRSGVAGICARARLKAVVYDPGGFPSFKLRIWKSPIASRIVRQGNASDVPGDGRVR